LDHPWLVNVRLRMIAREQGGVFSRRQALSSGCTADQVARYLRDGRWVRIRRGQYAERVDLAALEPWERVRREHHQKIHAVMNSLRSGSVAVSHQSALLLHALPSWGLELGRVHVNRLDAQAGGLVAGVQHHLGKLTAAEVTVVDGRLTTTVGRAIAETACTTTFEVAVVIVDAALRAYNLGDSDIQRLMELIEFWPGSAVARAALRFGNRLSESVGESRMRVLLHDHGLPDPVLQAEIYDSEGLVGRVDFYFPAYATVVEFDGAMKYGGGSPEVLIREKRREDRLRALGLTVVRSDWSDFDRPAHLVTTIRQSLARTNRAA
jgi:hypothetical protein